MFGKNIVISQHIESSGALKIVDLFYTIQGEGPYNGMPSVFVRLAGCNLRCTWCFIPSTLITMGDFTKKRIDQIAVGDVVLSWSGTEFVKKQVLKTMRSIADTIVKVDAGGLPVWCTPEHPFLVSGKGWVEAANLLPGDLLVHLSASDIARMNNPRTRAKQAGRIKPMSTALRKEFGKRMAKHWKDPVYHQHQVDRMTSNNPMKQAGVAIKAFKTMSERNKFKMTGLERDFLKACEGMPLDYVGDGSLIIGDKCPDFIVPGTKKLIEIWASDAEWSKGRGTEYVDERAKHFAKSGYETLFLPLTYANFRQRDGGLIKLRERVGQYISNGKVVKSVTVVQDKALARIYGKAGAEKQVYNFEVEDTHTYVANGMVVHNCDTDFETGAKVRDVDNLIELIETAANHRTKLVVITGGEPLLQNIVPLIKELTRRQYRTQIETAGTVWVPGLEECDVTFVCSPKTGKVNKEIFNRCKHFKYVVGVGDTITADGHIITATQPGAKAVELARPKDGTTIWIQPRDDHNTERNAENLKFAADLCLAHGYRMGVQLHKLIGVE